MYIKDVVKVQLVSAIRGTLVYPSFVYTLHDALMPAPAYSMAVYKEYRVPV